MPADGSTGVDRAASVRATFDEPLDASTVTGGSVQLRDALGALVPATVGYTAATRTATLAPTAPMAAGAQYTATVTTGVEDAAGNALAQARTWSFTTAPVAPDPDPEPEPGGEPGDEPPAGGTGAAGGTGTPATPGRGTSGTPAAAAADRVPPRVQVGPRRARVSGKGAAKLRVACPGEDQGCRVTVRLRLAGRTIATRTVTVTAGSARSVSLPLSRRARRALARHGSLRATAIASARDAAGNRATSRISIRLIAPQPGGTA